jgi:oligopeptide transport system ATP-binding protein
MLFSAENIHTRFHLRKKTIHAVRGVNLSVGTNEKVGIVGESGSGKTVLCLSFLRLLPAPPANVEGTIIFDNQDILKSNMTEFRKIRGNKICMVFQDPLSSFNPYLRLSDQLIEPLRLHCDMGRKEALDIAIEMFSKTGVPDAAHRIHYYPHEFSGGMLQRAMISMALITKPQLLIADEPTTALDVTIQAQILDLMHQLCTMQSMSTIFITHNLGIVAHFCDRVYVMYAGKIVEVAATRALFKETAHPYTLALIKSVPAINQDKDSLHVIPGTLPDPSMVFTGCPFAPRCTFAKAECSSAEQELFEFKPGHFTSCIRVLNGEVAL